jgi:hypothetical protein
MVSDERGHYTAILARDPQKRPIIVRSCDRSIYFADIPEEPHVPKPMFRTTSKLPTRTSSLKPGTGAMGNSSYMELWPRPIASDAKLHGQGPRVYTPWRGGCRASCWTAMRDLQPT